MLLLFLTTHEEEHAHKLGFDMSLINTTDVESTVSIKDQTVTLSLANGMTFVSQEKYDYYTFLVPAITEEPGKLYRRGTNVPV
ncbi:hypothetical protein, partial [Gordonia rhizosphera]|uniref:hypothetical protein n=1 Tax=Gordonia rhizosphera TaxID=83341 RepID=UPI001C3F1C23